MGIFTVSDITVVLVETAGVTILNASELFGGKYRKIKSTNAQAGARVAGSYSTVNVKGFSISVPLGVLVELKIVCAFAKTGLTKKVNNRTANSFLIFNRTNNQVNYYYCQNNA